MKKKILIKLVNGTSITMLVAILNIFALNVCFSQETAKDNSLISFKSGDKWGLKDATGNIIVPAKYAMILEFSEGMAAVNVGGKMKTEYLVIDNPVFFSREKFAGGKWGFINTQGEEILPCKYEDASSFSGGLAVVKLKKKYGFIDKSGNVVIPCIYDDAKPFSEGLAAVESKNQYGFIDKSGNVVIPCIYGDAKPFSEGLAAVAEVKSSEVKTTYEYGGSHTVIGRKWGFINAKGTVVISFEYFIATPFENGKAEVKDFKGEQYLINTEGKKIEP